MQPNPGLNPQAYRRDYYTPALRIAHELDALARRAETLGFGFDREGVAGAIQDCAAYVRWNAADCLAWHGDDAELAKVKADPDLMTRALDTWNACQPRLTPAHRRAIRALLQLARDARAGLAPAGAGHAAVLDLTAIEAAETALRDLDPLTADAPAPQKATP